MTREIFFHLKRLALGAFGLSIIFVFTATSGAAAQKPNIIFILTDDLGYGDLGVFWQNARREKNDRSEPWHLTPKLDAMAKEGAQLTDHYCAAPVCAPSRASLLLGVHQGHSNIRDNQFDDALENNHTLGTVLKSAGYDTAAIGKWGLQGNGKDPSTWPAYPTKRGFDYFLGYVRHRDGHEHYPKEGLHRGAKEVWENEKEISATLDKCYTTDLFTARAKKYILDHHAANAGKPFFLYLAYDTPHAVTQLPTQAYPKGSGKNGGLQWLGKSGEMINTASGQIDSWYHPEYAQATYDSDRDSKTPEIAWPDVYKRYATSVRRIDDGVGDILQTLKDLRLENTLVIFTSDNGPSVESYLKEKLEADFFNNFGPFDGIKRDLWEGGLRVPTIAWWLRKIRPGTVSTQPGQSHDWLPTFAEIAGIPSPARTDGVSLLPALTGRGKQKPTTVYSEYLNPGKTPDYPEFFANRRGRERGQMQSIRFGNYQGVRYAVKSHADDFEIYDVTKDPRQRINLAGKTAMARLQQKMKEDVLRLRRPDRGAPRPYDGELVPAVKVHSAKPGVAWSAFKETFPWVPKLRDFKPAKSGTTTSPSLAMRPRDDNFALLFEGYIVAPTNGDYTLFLSVDTGALLRLHEATVIDADFGYAAGTEKNGTIRLQAGHHPFRLYYRHSQGGKPSLHLSWSGPGLSKQPIPESAFYHGGKLPK